MTDQDTEELIRKVLESIENSPMTPEDIVAAINAPQDEVDHAIQLIIERGQAAPDLDWQLAPISSW